MLSKTDQLDVNGIVPEASKYIPEHLPADKRTEHYGLRYTVRSNGKESVIIITNPLNVAVTAQLDFDKVKLEEISSASGVNVLFEKNSDIPATSREYKVTRDSGIDLKQNTLRDQYSVAFSPGRKLTLDFGPLDVKDLKFNKL